MDIAKRVTILKGYETEIYSVCLHLLQCEEKAIEAAKTALFNIIKDDKFFHHKEKDSEEWMRKEATKASMDIYKKSIRVEYGRVIHN
ncbi:hypothetical protein SD71_10200 [Cohnella kolymensis]|uniref:HEPN domain-containing protein n=2 Tax=Cohnella kolymensis TaxID=1590652 RepID=A0ABR5A540_9BACL|nr:hypothetical protein SD71_10200 [Cohnella kolymensis]